MDSNKALQYGYAYYNGTGGMPLDKKKGVAYFAQAAKEGNAEAYYVLGSVYEEGTVIQMDLQKAAMLYESSVKNGYKPAAAKLGDCYYNGKGVVVNKDKAFSYYKVGAEAGHGGCAYMMAHMYLTDYKNYSEAYKWFWIALEHKVNVAHCYHNIAFICQKRMSGKNGIHEAMKYYKMAADMGFEQSMDMYGLLLDMDGQKDEAIQYLEMAVQKGYAPAKNHLKIVKFYNGNGAIRSLLGL